MKAELAVKTIAVGSSSRNLRARTSNGTRSHKMVVRSQPRGRDGDQCASQVAGHSTVAVYQHGSGA